MLNCKCLVLLQLILTPGKYRRSGKVVSPRSKVLEQCGQEDYVSFTDCFTPAMMRNAVKIGEGVYGEVFRSQRGRNTSVALKVSKSSSGVQCLSQDLETGCLKLAVVKSLGVQFF